jgi:hypothetical protein
MFVAAVSQRTSLAGTRMSESVVDAPDGISHRQDHYDGREDALCQHNVFFLMKWSENNAKL